MKNYATRPNALLFLTSIPAKVPLVVLQASRSIHEAYPYAKAVPADRGIGSLGKSIETFKGEDLIIIKEERDTKGYDAGFQSYLWDRWVMDMYPLVLPHKVKRSLERLHVLCLR